MARGWESKSVEGQIEESAQSLQAEPAQDDPASTDAGLHLDSAAKFERQHKLSRMRLMRSQLAGQLKNARSVAQRQALNQSLRAIDAELAEMESLNGQAET